MYWYILCSFLSSILHALWAFIWNHDSMKTHPKTQELYIYTSVSEHWYRVYIGITIYCGWLVVCKPLQQRLTGKCISILGWTSIFAVFIKISHHCKLLCSSLTLGSYFLKYTGKGDVIVLKWALIVIFWYRIQLKR